jgi:hypothetical protein
MSITASAHVIEGSSDALPTRLHSRPDTRAAQPNPSLDNIVWGTSAAEDIASSGPPGDGDVVCQVLVASDSSSGRPATWASM